MISILNTIPKLITSENKTHLRFKSNSYLQSNGTKASMTITFTTWGAMLGSEFKITVFNKAITYVFDTTTNISTNSIKKLTGAMAGTNFALWVKEIKRVISSNYILDKYFDISYTNNTITLTAKQFGNEYSLTGECLPNGTPYTPFTFSTTAGTNMSIKPFYGIIFQLRNKVNDSIILEDKISVNAAGETDYFDIQNAISSLCKSNITYPESPNELIINHPESIGMFYYKIAESSGYDDMVSNWQIVSQDILCINANLSKEYLYTLNKSGTTFYSQLMAGKKFLSFYPGAKTVFPSQTEKLFFIVPLSGELKINIAYKYTETNIVQSGNYSYDAISVNRFQFIEIAAGLKTLNLEAITGKTIDSYELFLTVNNQVVSEVKKYNVNHDHIHRKKQILFQNSLGGFDTLVFTGEISQNNEFEKNAYSDISNKPFTRDPELKVINTSKKELFTANTGWLSKETLKWIEDLFFSKNTFLIENDTLVPIFILSDNILWENENELPNLSFKYYKNYSDNGSGEFPIISITDNNAHHISPIISQNNNQSEYSPITQSII